jgi:Sulfotransferase family
VSIVYKKPAKTGSTTINAALPKMFPKAQRADCRGHTEFDAIGAVLYEGMKYDMFLCHTIFDAETVSTLSEHAKFPQVRLTTIRDPVQQLLSLYYHRKRSQCGKGRLPEVQELEAFIEEHYSRFVPSFYSRPYDVKQLSASLAREECAYFDVIWKTDELKTVLENPLHKLAREDCPEKKQMAENKDLMEVLKKATAAAKLLYEEMKQCKNVLPEVPWEWDDAQNCLVYREKYGFLESGLR